MTTIHAIYQDGVFKPKEPVVLPEACEVELEIRVVNQVPFPQFISHPNPSPEEFRRLLDAMAASPPGKTLPADFSREDIYDDHD